MMLKSFISTHNLIYIAPKLINLNHKNKHYVPTTVNQTMLITSNNTNHYMINDVKEYYCSHQKTDQISHSSVI